MAAERWKGHPEPTPEPLSSLLRDIKDPKILADIEQCKLDFLLTHPGERVVFEKENGVHGEDDELAQAVRRENPHRTARPTTFAVFGVHDDSDHINMTAQAIRTLTAKFADKIKAEVYALPDFTEYEPPPHWTSLAS